MKKIKIILVFLFSTLCFCNENVDIKETDTKAEISKLIAISFLQIRKTFAEANLKNKSIDEKIFGTDSSPAQVNVRDIKMKINRESGSNGELVLIEIQLEGAPEDFEGKEILASEKDLLKYIILDAYLKRLNTHKNKPVSVILDEYTKVTCPPEFMVHKRNAFDIMTTVCNTRKSMQLMTIFPLPEFEKLVQEYFIVKQEEVKENSDEKTKTNNVGFFSNFFK